MHDDRPWVVRHCSRHGEENVARLEAAVKNETAECDRLADILIERDEIAISNAEENIRLRAEVERLRVALWGLTNAADQFLTNASEEHGEDLVAKTNAAKDALGDE